MCHFYLQVRNAIQALQEMTTPSSCTCSIANYSAHSNPNITAELQHPRGVLLVRSSSQPPELFNWDAPPSPAFHALKTYADCETQTDWTDAMHEYILENPKNVLEILGLDPEKILNGVNVRKSHSIPDYIRQCNRDYVSDLSNNRVDMCTVDVYNEDSEDCKGEHCPFLSKGTDREVQIFEAVHSNKSHNSLLKLRRNNID